ncbi:hypothetical protein HK105_207488 [Polyrhizophydium stewartii]|uniref:Mitochondrial zinc maintenance protein 1, mitochondrial n=1 Tax=Polyrhizophydium stewartii TaxID=2732419 RepID=A0ABR4N0H6_9FUNG
MSHSRVLAAYRGLLRAQRKTFRNDGARIADAARFTRNEFLKNKKDISDPAKLEQLVQVAEQASALITHNVVQAVRKPTSSELFELRITPDTELGSNDSIKKARGASVGAVGTGCCGGAAKQAH